MSEENDSLLKSMRGHREDAVVAFKKFTEHKNEHQDYAFCFYEGEDAKYYNLRIEKFFGQKYFVYKAGNKKAVLHIMEMIQSKPEYSEMCTMFFVDRDYDSSLQGKSGNLFETPCYSIENLYARKEAYARILKAEFGLNLFDDDYKKCIELYEKRLAEFNQIILEFNALVKYKHQRCPEQKCRFSNVKTNHLANITLETVKKSNDYSETIDALKGELNVNEEDFRITSAELEGELKSEDVFRGKNQLDFFSEIIKKLRDANDRGGFFSRKLDNVHINITNNRLSELSQYAITPDELKAFLQKNFEKLQIQ